MVPVNDKEGDDAVTAKIDWRWWGSTASRVAARSSRDPNTKPAFHTSRSCVHIVISQLILSGLAIRYPPETQHIVGLLVFRQLLADATLQITRNAMHTS